VSREEAHKTDAPCGDMAASACGTRTIRLFGSYNIFVSLTSRATTLAGTRRYRTCGIRQKSTGPITVLL